MADSGQPDKSSSRPPVPKWAPTPDDKDAPKHSGEPASSATPSPFGGDYAATMRVIPVPPPTTPPPPFGIPSAPPAGDPTPPEVPGERYIGKYRVKGELGRGGMGAVYLAEQPGLGREVAIKELIQSADPLALRRFLQEAQVMARTSHPNLVQVHDMELQGSVNYLVLEFIKGRSMRDWMNQSSIPPPQVFAVMHGILQALDYAHRHQIVHRDMKPENVLISDTGLGGTATKTGTTVGTPQYMSPEQVSSSKVDGRSDLYSAGIVFYELVVGQPPFTASDADGPFTLMAKHVQAPPKPPSVFKPGLNLELEAVILKSISKRPEDRYQSGADFDDAMSRVADQMCPGWTRSLEPGADLSKMVPRATPANALPATPIGMAIAQPSTAIPYPHVVYNPTPPVKPVAKNSLGCISAIGALVVVLTTVAVLVGSLVH